MSKVKVSAGLVSSESSLLGLQMATLSPCPNMVFPLCIRVPRVPPPVCPDFLFL